MSVAGDLLWEVAGSLWKNFLGLVKELGKMLQILETAVHGNIVMFSQQDLVSRTPVRRSTRNSKGCYTRANVSTLPVS